MMCPSCGGVVGRDCFNPDECAWITQQMAADSAVERAMHERDEREYGQYLAAEHGEYLQREWEQHCIEDLGFDPISLGC